MKFDMRLSTNDLGYVTPTAAMFTSVGISVTSYGYIRAYS